MSRLKAEVDKFKEWAKLRLAQGSGPWEYGDGEWECDYAELQDMRDAAEEFISSQTDKKVSAADLDLLLYALARDNEDEVILDTLEEHLGVAIQVITAAKAYPDTQAKWQAADLLGRIGSEGDIDTLNVFVSDADEYVSRRARYALKALRDRLGLS